MVDVNILTGKNVLLFVPAGPGIYGSGISKELKQRGANVYVFDERPSKSTLSKVAIRLGKQYAKPYLFSYYRKIIDYLNVTIDYILIVRGEGVTEEVMSLFRDKWKNATIILYLWDSVKNTDTTSVMGYFDKVLSFDPFDAEFYKLEFRPLFYLPEYNINRKKNQYTTDLAFIGTVHSDRYEISQRLKIDLENRGGVSYYYYYYPSRLLYFRDKYLKRKNIDVSSGEVFFKMLPLNKVTRVFSDSRCTLDIHSPSQVGLTMRSVETIGARVKLITTNDSISKYDFYHPENINVISRNECCIDLDFVRSPYRELDSDILYKYSIGGWVDEVFNV